MNLHNSIKPKNNSMKSKTRVGRGPGSKGKTAGRGLNGAKSRTGYKTTPWRTSGGATFVMQTPTKRGFTRGKFIKHRTATVNVNYLLQKIQAGLDAQEFSDLFYKITIKSNDYLSLLEQVRNTKLEISPVTYEVLLEATEYDLSNGKQVVGLHVTSDVVSLIDQVKIKYERMLDINIDTVNVLSYAKNKNFNYKIIGTLNPDSLETLKKMSKSQYVFSDCLFSKSVQQKFDELNINYCKNQLSDEK